MRKLLLGLSILGLASACASLQTTRASDDEVYREDLSTHRPTFSIPEDTVGTRFVNKVDYSNVTPSHDVTSQLNEVLDAGDEYRSEDKFVDGYTIQIYTGSSSEEARILRGKALAMMPDADVELFYDEPSFKVKLGKYYSRLEAQKDFSGLKEKFPMAIIIPDKIPIPE